MSMLSLCVYYDLYGSSFVLRTFEDVSLRYSSRVGGWMGKKLIAYLALLVL